MINQKLNEINIIYTSTKTDKRRITCGEDAYRMFLDVWNMDIIDLQEEFKVLLLNKANHILGVYNLSKGGIDGTVADIRLLFTVALKTASVGIILAHNHPSGILKPSHADKMLTNKIRSSGEMLTIKVLDHLIISKDGYFSFEEEGI